MDIKDKISSKIDEFDRKLDKFSDRASMTNLYSRAASVADKNALKLRNKCDSIVDIFLDLKIDDCNFGNRNRPFMERLMKLNIFEKDITLSSLSLSYKGDLSEAHSNGDSDNINSLPIYPSYAKDREYVNTFVRDVKSSERFGVLSTKETLTNGDNTYQEYSNLYPDDLDIGSFKEKWDVSSNRNSILNKTKQLFNSNKINTLISRFGTGCDGDSSNIKYNGSVSTNSYGESRGRNLLKKDAEMNNGKYPENGYNNPYCRVWTHHYQYDKLGKTMRSIDGENSSHSFWSKEFDKSNDSFEWRDKNNSWDKSVITDNGFPNITPKYLEGNKSIHTKDCMFSIENLAWKDYVPYSFENSLSWEQRGPNGGRIMWFPPYGLNFSESTNANWASNTFIGRGEDVYTYVNSSRTGSLSFMMVVDHPSVLDYVSWDMNSNRKDVNDNDILRFFAGCDTIDGNDEIGSILSKTTPQPIFEGEEESRDTIETETVVVEDVSDTDSDNNDIKICFNVYFPNNYSGCYDNDEDSQVEPIAYLLGGFGSQKKEKEDIPIKFDNITSIKGYEINDKLSNKDKQNADKNYILGSKYKFSQYKENSKYVENANLKWYYRIDGEYTTKQGGSDRYNTYDQILKEKNYSDDFCFNLNKNVNDELSDEFVHFSLLEVCYTIAKKCGYKTTLESITRILDANNKKNIEKLEDYISRYEIKECNINGYASVHGYENLNKNLANYRATTVKKFLKKYTDIDTIKIIRTNIPKNKKNYSIYEKSIKSNRYARVEITFRKTKTDKEYSVNTKNSNNRNSNNGINGNENEIGRSLEKGDSLKNTYRYDQEMYFFKKLEKESPLVYKNLMDKIQYFDPAFHSMTPEGFNGRLTFLQQCMRQGNTKTMSDKNGNTANNLAFGRPPFCVLRIGDFYNQMIVIDSLNIDYNVSGGVQWDFNIEGIGAQPLLANVTINFKFIGGGDLNGPVKRLQNAMTFNYYANARLYDNRSDRYEYDNNHNIIKDKSYSYSQDSIKNNR